MPRPSPTALRVACLLALVVPVVPAAAQPDGTTKPAAVAVTARPVRSVQIYPLREAPAATVARNESRLGAELAARIAAIPVEVGQTVPSGAVVVQLDAADAQLALAQADAALASARARLALADSQLERARNLQRQQFISAEALTQRETELAVVRAEVLSVEASQRVARRALDKTRIRAPFRGVVLERPGQVGEIAQPGAPLVVLKDAAVPEVSADIPAAYARDFVPAATFEFVSSTGRYPLRLLRLSPAVRTGTRTQEARLAFAQADAAAAAGTEGRLAWRASVPHLPAETIVQRGAAGAVPVLGVFVVEGLRARFVPIAGAQAGRPAPSPLAPDARVVVGGQAALQDGAAVTATNP